MHELSCTFCRNDLNERSLLGDGFVGDRLERPLNLITAAVDVVQVELELHQKILPTHRSLDENHSDPRLAFREGAMVMTDFTTLPDDLPAPEDDGAAEHLPGMSVPAVDGDFGAPQRFVPQMERAKRRLRASVGIGAALSLLWLFLRLV